MQIKNLLPYPVYYPYAAVNRGTRLDPQKLSGSLPVSRLEDRLLQRDLKAHRIKLVLTPEEQRENAELLRDLGIPLSPAAQSDTLSEPPAPVPVAPPPAPEDQVVLAQEDVVEAPKEPVGYSDAPADATEDETAPDEAGDAAPAADYDDLRQRLQGMPWADLRSLASAHPTVSATGGRDAIVEALIEAEAAGTPVFPAE